MILLFKQHAASELSFVVVNQFSADTVETAAASPKIDASASSNTIPPQQSAVPLSITERLEIAAKHSSISLLESLTALGSWARIYNQTNQKKDEKNGNNFCIPIRTSLII